MGSGGGRRGVVGGFAGAVEGTGSAGGDVKCLDLISPSQSGVQSTGHPPRTLPPVSAKRGERRGQVPAALE